MYGQTGVCEVADVCEKEIIRNKKILYYTLKPGLSSGSVIYAPVENLKIPMRNIISKAQAENLINNIPEILKNSKPDDYENYEEYKSDIASLEPEKLVKITSKIWGKKKQVKALKKRLNAMDEKYMKIAEKLLFGELSVALNIPFDKINEYIEDKLDK